MGVDINVPISELQKRTLFLATPMYGGMCHGLYARSVADLAAQCAKMGIPLRIYLLFNESLITRARAYATDEFMRSGDTHMLFIDSDVGFSPPDIIAMLAMMSDESPYDVMAGPYPKKCISWEKIKAAVDKGYADEDPTVLDKFVGDYVFNTKAGTPSFRVDQPVEVLESGTGFMMIRRRTLEVLHAAMPDYMYRPDHVRTEHFDGTRNIHMTFQAEIDRTNFEKIYREAIQEALKETDPVKAAELLQTALDTKETRSLRYLSEDYWFCQRIAEHGMKIFLCPWMRTQHAGSFVFGGSLMDIAQLGAHPTVDPSKLKKKKV